MPVHTVTYRDQPHEVTWFGTSDEGQLVAEIRPTGRRSGPTQTVTASEVDCAHGYRLSDSCPTCPELPTTRTGHHMTTDDTGTVSGLSPRVRAFYAARNEVIRECRRRQAELETELTDRLKAMRAEYEATETER